MVASPLRTILNLMQKLSYRLPSIGRLFSGFMGVAEVHLLDITEIINKIIPGFKDRVIRFFGAYWGSRVIPLNKSIDSQTSISTTDEILEIIKREKNLFVGYCYCRNKHAKKNNCHYPIWTCIHIGVPSDIRMTGKLPPDTKRSSYKEIEQLLHTTDIMGLVHQLVFFPSPDQYYVICNCCPCCCTTLSNLRRIGNPAVVQSNFIAAPVDTEKCVNCGNCVKYCYFDARKIEDGKLVYYPEKCFGCGLCVTHCPTKAVVLKKKGKK